MLTVICHTYNEQYLLKWWLPHHAAIADHGIIIDYASTDDTVALVHQYAPDWEVIQSRNSCFRATDCDNEVMDVERGIDGWKICLTATEFVVGDITALTDNLAIQGYAATALRPVAMVDLKERMSVIGEQPPLTELCHTGYMDGWIVPYKSRILHCHKDGDYNVGRHSTNHSHVLWHPDGALLKWYGFAPYTKELRQRKLQIQTRMPDDDIQAGRGFQHILDDDKLRLMWQSEVAVSGDLTGQPGYF